LPIGSVDIAPRADRPARGGARVADRGRAVVPDARVQHRAQFLAVRRRHHDQARQAPQVAQVEVAVVGRAVRADETGAVDRERDGQLLQVHVVHELVVRALQEGRVDRDHRPQAPRREAGRERHRVLLGDPDVEIAVREALGELHEAGALAHRRRDRDDARVALGHLAQPVPEHLRVGRRRLRRRQQADLRVERRHAVVLDRFGRRRRVAVPLFRPHVQEARATPRAQVAQRLDQPRQVVAVDRPDVLEAERLEQRAAGQVVAPDPREVVLQRADVRRDRHPVVVQHDQQVRADPAGVVERLERHAGGQRAVADDRDRARIAAGTRVRDRHAERRADRRARVAGAERVVLALTALQEPRQAATTPDRRQGVPPAGQDLVRVGLVADVPDERVAGRVVDVVQRDRELDGAQARREVAAGAAHGLHQPGAEFVRDARQALRGQAAEIRGVVDAFEQRSRHGLLTGGTPP
jgi:hypothetical protein